LSENQELASLRDANKNYCNAGRLVMFYLLIIIEALDHKGLFSPIFGLIFLVPKKTKNIAKVLPQKHNI
jgi:hypothetical protein